MQSMQLTKPFCGSQSALQSKAQRGCGGRAARPALIRAQIEPEAQVAPHTILDKLMKAPEGLLAEYSAASVCLHSQSPSST